MDNETEQTIPSVPEDVQSEFEEWLDKSAIAEIVADALREEGLPVTLENMKAVWSDHLSTRMGSDMTSDIRYLAGDGRLTEAEAEEG